MQANLRNYGSRVAGLFDIILNSAPVKTEPGYVSVAGKEGDKILAHQAPCTL